MKMKTILGTPSFAATGVEALTTSVEREGQQ
jgi:hypothetical protein